MTDIRAREIARRGETLQEKLDPEWALPESTDCDEVLTEWRELVADGNDERFRARLAHDGLTVEMVRERLQSAREGEEDASGTAPEWVAVLDELVESIPEQLPNELDHRAIDPSEPLPFENIVAHFVTYARNRLEARASLDGLSTDALASLERWLLRRLTTICSRAFYAEFRGFLAVRDLGILIADPGPSREGSTARYREFVAETLADGLGSFFAEYAVLGRLTVSIVEDWIDFVSSLCRRLERDEPAIGATFAPDGESGPIVDVDPGLSDPHDGGRTVLGLTFASGLELVYKPRDVHIEAAFFGFLEWIGDDGSPTTFRTPTVLAGDGYGWVERIAAEECETEETGRRYYRRLGALACVLYVLDATDCHLENVIAAGEHPVLVDCEAIMHPEVAPDRMPAGQARAPVMADQGVAGSVLKTGLLPHLGSGDGHVDATVLGAIESGQADEKQPVWTDVNRDAMGVEYERPTLPDNLGVPRNDGEILRPEGYETAVCAGFEETYRFFLDQQETLLSNESPLEVFEGIETRFIFRPTSTYRDYVDATAFPERLRSGIEYGLHVEGLAKALLESSAADEHWPLYEREQAALRRLDVPRFTVRTDEPTIRHRGQPLVADAFAEAGLFRIRRRIERLSEANLQEQLAYVRLSLGQPDLATVGHDAGELAGESWHVRDESISNDELLEAAAAIGRRVLANAIETADGYPTWLTVTHDASGRPYLRRVGETLYDGRPGIALLFAALSVVTGEETYRDDALEIVAPLRATLPETIDSLDGLPVGGGSGVASIAYALATLAELLEREELLADGRRVATALTAERIDRDPHLDVIGGSAGAILGLLSVYRATGDEEILDRARRCGDRLLDRRIRTDDGHTSWPTKSTTRPSTGFSHGNAGIAYALSRLASTTGNDRYGAVARDAIRGENAVYVEDVANWADFRDRFESDEPRFADAWCHGRAGIGLSRVGTLPFDDEDGVREDVDAALSEYSSLALATDDHLCCGNAGRIEFLLTAGRRLDDAGPVGSARRLAASVVDRAERMGGYSYEAAGSLYDPTLFRGTAGIGYELLRVHSPDDLPSILLWE